MEDNDVFNGNVPAAIKVRVNGTLTTQTVAPGANVQATLSSIAQRHGLKSYSAWIDGRKLTTADMSAGITGSELSVEAIHTKGAR